MKKIILLLGIIVFICACIGEDKKKILVIESYHAEYLWDANYVKGLKSALADKYTLEFFHMDTKRIPKEEHQDMGVKAIDKYHSMEPDLVIIGDDAALRYTGPRLARTNTPVVFLGINNNPANYFMEWPKNITGILERPLLQESIGTIKRLMPGVQRIAVLFDTDLTAKVVHAELFESQDTMRIADVDVDIKMFGSFSEWQNFVAQSGDTYQACIMGLYHTLKDNSGTLVDPEEVAKWTSSNTPVPLFAFWDFTVSPEKSVGGLVVSGEEQGRMAAAFVERIFAGSSPSDIVPMSGGNGELLFSKTQLAKHKLSIPEGLEARFID